MRQRTSHISSAVLAALIMGALVGGCDDPAPAETAQAEAAAPEPAETPAQSERYSVVSPTAPVSVGEAASAEIAFAPGAGLKINHEFPWRLELEPNEALGVEARTLTKDDFELANKKASLTVDVAAQAAGEHELAGTADLSVCTETQCYVMRQQKVAFAIAAEADAPAAPDAPADRPDDGQPTD